MSALIWSPFGNEAQAREIARTLLQERLIACANILPPMQSVFIWQDEISEGSEVAVLFKTRSDLLARAIERIEQLHPYETPAITGWYCDGAGVATGEWLGELAGAADGDHRST